MSTRQSREELIKKGVLKEVYEKGERAKSEGSDPNNSHQHSGEKCFQVILDLLLHILHPYRWLSAGAGRRHKTGERAVCGSGLQSARVRM